MAKIQCWDYKKCGREKDRTCPAVTQSAGRSCWLVAGTLCGGRIEGTHAAVLGNCKLCDFYSQVKTQRI